MGMCTNKELERHRCVHVSFIVCAAYEMKRASDQQAGGDEKVRCRALCVPVASLLFGATGRKSRSFGECKQDRL